MTEDSILLALSGSQQSRYAAEVAWRLSQVLRSKMTAHHVIDTHNAWQFIGQEKPGFLDSELYVNAYQGLCKSMYILAEELAEAYTSDAKRLSVDDTCIIDEGNPMKEICRRADDHNLVVIGHRPQLNMPQEDTTHYTEFVRLSLAESLAIRSPRPLLIVQGACKSWTSLAIMISMEHINEKYINSCLDLAKALDLPASLIVIECGGIEEELSEFVSDLRSANNRLEGVPIAFTNAKQGLSDGAWLVTGDADIARNGLDSALIVMPTREIANERLTVLTSSPAVFVRYLKVPSILLWPEEYVYSFGKAKQKRKFVGAEI